MSAVQSSKMSAVATNGMGSDSLLRLALKLDAAITGVNGLAYLLAAPILSNILGAPESVQRPMGALSGAVWVGGVLSVGPQSA